MAGAFRPFTLEGVPTEMNFCHKTMKLSTLLHTLAPSIHVTKMKGLNTIFYMLLFLHMFIYTSRAVLLEEISFGVEFGLHHVESLPSYSLSEDESPWRTRVQRSTNRKDILEDRGLEVNINETITSPVVSGNGDYVMQFQIGSPPQNFSVVVDTGSDLIWLQSKTCRTCFEHDGADFDETVSSSYHNVTCTSSLCHKLPTNHYRCSLDGDGTTCEYIYGYGDGSRTTGDFATETLTLETMTNELVSIPDIAFGCGINNSFRSPNNFGGLVGLGRGPLSFISQLGDRFSNRFAYCLVPLSDANTRKSSPIVIGDMARITSNDGVQTFDLVSHWHPDGSLSSFYYVDLQGIVISGNKLDLPSGIFDVDSDSGKGGVIIDSGTTLTILVAEAFTPLNAALRQAINYPLVDGSTYGFAETMCFSTAGESIDSLTLPSVTFLFTGAQWELPHDNTYVIVDEDVECAAFISNGNAPSISILGNIQQQNFEVLFDLDASKVSIKPTKCDESSFT